MKITAAILAVMMTIGVTACGRNNPTAPTVESVGTVDTVGDSGRYYPLSVVANTVWTGTSTTNNATTGHSGTASVTFTAGGPTGDVAASIVWTLGGSAVVFNGTASGTPANIVLSAPSGLTHGCSQYSANGVVNGNHFTGTYNATCHNAVDAVQGDSGTFSLTRVEEVDPNTTFCHVPPGNPAQAQTLSLPLVAINAGHIPQHSLDHLGACTGNEGQQ